MIADKDSNGIVIVGGGIYGASVAYDLASAGQRVTLLEAGEIACGASGGPGERGVRAANRDMRELPVVALAQRRWKALQENIAGGVGYRRIGGFQVFDIPYGQRKNEVLAEITARARAQEALGIPSTVLGRDEVLKMEPELSPGIAGALFCPNDGVGDHTFATRQLAAAAQQAGATIRTGAKVVEVLHDKGAATCVRLSDGETVAVGGQLILLANTGVMPLMQPFLQAHEVMPVWNITPQMMYVSNPEGRTISHLLSHRTRKLAVKQLRDGTIMISGGWSVERGENGGLHGSLSAIALNLNDAIATFPFLDRSEFQGVDGSRADTSAIDGIPIIGRPAVLDNVIYGFAWSGHGFAISLGFAKHISDWAMTGKEPDELAPFSPRRFFPRQP